MSADSPTFDLQSHSLHSDGALPAGDVVAAAAEAGVELLALSDHDTVDGVQQALDAASDAGIRVVTAVEISSVDRDQQDLHVLGYVVDHDDEVLRERLRSWRGDREQRADAMAAALRELGYELDESELERRKAEGKTIGRPHLADAVVRHAGNAERLRSEGLDELSAFLEAYLIDGKPAFKPRTKPTVCESIAAINDAGGVAVRPACSARQGRPRRARDDRSPPVMGIDGVECFRRRPTSASRPSCSPTAAPSWGC